MAAELSPDLVVMDVMMPRKDGVEACRDIMDFARDACRHADGRERGNGSAGGAGRWCDRVSSEGTDRERLLSTLRGVFWGELRLPAELARGVVAAIRCVSEAGDAAEAAGLTAREREILVSFAGGMTYTRIAEQRGIRPVTVRNAIYGIQQSWVSPRCRDWCYGQLGTGCWMTMTRRVRDIHPGNQRCSEREMVQGSRYSRGVHLVTTAANVLGITGWEHSEGDPEGLRLIARTFVWARWLIVAFGLLLWVYRPVEWLETYALYVPGILLLVGLNGYTHYRLATNKTVTRRWILANATLDVFILSNAVALGGGLSFLYLLYYPQLAGYAVILTSFWLTMACATFVSVLYLVISLTVGDGIDTAAAEERTLLARILVMYAVAAIVNIIARFERARWRRAVARARPAA